MKVLPFISLRRYGIGNSGEWREKVKELVDGVIRSYSWIREKLLLNLNEGNRWSDCYARLPQRLFLLIMIISHLNVLLFLLKVSPHTSLKTVGWRLTGWAHKKRACKTVQIGNSYRFWHISWLEEWIIKNTWINRNSQSDYQEEAWVSAFAWYYIVPAAVHPHRVPAESRYLGNTREAVAVFSKSLYPLSFIICHCNVLP